MFYVLFCFSSASFADRSCRHPSRSLHAVVAADVVGDRCSTQFECAYSINNGRCWHERCFCLPGHRLDTLTNTTTTTTAAPFTSCIPRKSSLAAAAFRFSAGNVELNSSALSLYRSFFPSRIPRSKISPTTTVSG